MEILEVDLEIKKGSLFEYDLLVTNSGASVDLTGYTGKLWVRDKRDSPTTLVELAAQLTFSGSTMLIRIPATETADYTFSAGVYDCKISPPSSAAANARHVMQGKFFVIPQITV